MILFALWQEKLSNFSWRYKLNTNGYNIQEAVSHPLPEPHVFPVLMDGCGVGLRGGRVGGGTKGPERNCIETSKRNFPCVLDCLKLLLLGVLQEKLLEAREKNLSVSLLSRRQGYKLIVGLLKCAAHRLITTKAEVVAPHDQRFSDMGYF